MSGPVRWTLAGSASVVAFALVVWLVRAASWGALPTDDGDRWAVATAAGAVVAAAVLYALTWWTSRAAGTPAAPPRGVVQEARASGRAVIDQAAHRRGPRPGDAHADDAHADDAHPDGRRPGGPSRRRPAAPVTQRATARGRARITQTGGDTAAPPQDPDPGSLGSAP
ncbi:hypothetical protein [Streptomyces sp. NRRL S-87]|uniref:hypothetical protein n=1 Tax=Streptomyces sp. NRRL S-87 TaxID=1463920 RepID=UPI0004BEE146|nr:hypothetical protein [Streptomyces sp. NRRL S-87]